MARRKSRRSRRKSYKRKRSKGYFAYKPSRGCSRQTSKKYRIRASPPFPANLCIGRVKKGNDGKMWISHSYHGIGRWKRV